MPDSLTVFFLHRGYTAMMWQTAYGFK